MTETEARAKVLDLLEDVTGEPEVREHLDEDLFELGFLDSMAAIELLVGLEDELGVSIAPTENWSAQEVLSGPQALPARTSAISEVFLPATSLDIAFRLPSQPPSNETFSMVAPSSERSMWIMREQTPRGRKSMC